VAGTERTGRDGGYRVVLGRVSAPPATLPAATASGERGWPWWQMAGLFVLAGRVPVTIVVPPARRSRAAITWGNRTGFLAALRIAGCPQWPGEWLGYAGGFFLRERSECVPLVFQVGNRSATVRFGFGRRCR